MSPLGSICRQSVKVQVLLCLQQRHSDFVINVFLLPLNTTVTENIAGSVHSLASLSGLQVKRQYGTQIPAVTSECTLRLSEFYALVCDSDGAVTIQPRLVEFDGNHGPSFQPDFEVFLKEDTDRLTLRLQKGGPGGKLVWNGDVNLSVKTSETAERKQVWAQKTTETAEKQLAGARMMFISSVSDPVLNSLLDRLMDWGVFTLEEVYGVRAQPVRSHRARAVLDMVRRKGLRASSIMTDLLEQYDPHLYTSLGLSQEEITSQPPSHPLCFPDLRMVLLGWRGTGKSSSGNTILGREAFDLKTAAQCVKRQGEVAGRQVTVVDTPGWLRNLPVERTPELVKQEIIHSFSLCPPGPHSLLLVIQGDQSFPEEDRRSIEQHMQLFNERVWSHTILLFTFGDCLKNSSNKQPNEIEGEALQWLVEKCGNRYHVFNNKSKDVTQVPELFEKIEKMATRNPGKHYEIESERLQKVELWRGRHKERAKRRQFLVEEQRKAHQNFMSDSLNLSELRVLLLGNTGAGKRSSGNTILGREEFDLRTAAQCVKRQGEVAGRQVTVVHTPGWTRNLPVEDSTELVKQFTDCIALCPPGPHAFLLVIPANMSFKDEEANAMEDHLDLLQKNVWSHILVLFSNGDSLADITIEQHIESEGKALHWLVEKCGNRYHVFDNKNRGDITQVTELLEKIEEMIAVNSGDHFYLRGVTEPEWMLGPVSLLTGARTIDRPQSGEEDGSSDRQSVVLSDSAYGSSASQRASQPIKQPKTHIIPPFFVKDESHASKSGSANSTTTEAEDLTVVIPALSLDVSYRLQCPGAGLFQCSSTGLMFLMKGEGDVLYKTVPWDLGLISSGLSPAGPLYSITCPQKTVGQLHLPHCELPEGGGLDALSVIHVSGDSVMVFPPLRVTGTHAVVKVPDLCCWGLLKKRKKQKAIKGQVLLFKNCIDSLFQCATVILLPRNVPIEKVRAKQEGFQEVQRTDCKLVSEEFYSLKCSPITPPEEEDTHIYDIYPMKTVQFDEDHGANYNPAFSVTLTKRLEMVRLQLLKGGLDGQEVWKGALSLKGPVTPPAAVSMPSGTAEGQLHSAKIAFIERVSDPVLDSLLLRLEEKPPPNFQSVFNSHEAEAVRAITVRQTKATKIMEMVINKGPTACSVLISSLKVKDPHLYRALQFSLSSTRGVASTGAGEGAAGGPV